MADIYSFFKDMARPCIASWHSLVHGRRTFLFRGRDYRYFFHAYNSTWRNERAVEMPILFDFLKGIPESEILEIGNVTGRYRPDRRHEVVDRYEVGKGVKNMDVVDIEGPARFRRIVAISTIEHVGYDETPRDSAKIGRALSVLQGLLVPGGEALVTIPIGYNPLLDADLRSGALRFDELAFLKAFDSGWGWREVPAEECWCVAFDQRLQAGRALAVGYLRKPVS